MQHILQIDASPLGAASISRQLTGAVVARLKAANPRSLVTHRDLIATPVSHLGPELLALIRPTPGSVPEMNPSTRAELAQTEELLNEFLAADVVVVGAPMINFSIPSQLKAWVDRIVQAGRTFSYTQEGGPVGLAVGKKAIIASSRGGVYSGTPYEAALDHQEAYLKAVFNFIGVTDLSYVRAEGVALNAEKRREALASAERDIAGLSLGYLQAA
jgi:FMN-dependent NADH-azoreductase